MNYLVAVRSHIGNKRTNNEDSYFYDKEYEGLIIIADGIGGYEGGLEASSLVVENVKQYFSAIKDEWDNYCLQLSYYLRKMNYKIIEKQMSEIRFCRMGTTATAVYIDKTNKMLYFAHIGDCRILVIRNGKCIQLTDDHNEAGEMISHGLVEKNELKLQSRNKLTRYLGQVEEVLIDTDEFKIQKKDFILIATDGVYGNIGNELVEKLISKSFETQNVVDINKISDNLLDYCLQVDGSDNVTFALIYFN